MAHVFVVELYRAPGCAVGPGFGVESPLPAAAPSACPTTCLAGPFYHLYMIGH